MTTIPMTTVNNSVTVMRNTIAKLSTTALSANTETALEWKEDDQKTVLVINNTGSNAATFTVLAGNGIQGAADLVVSAAAGINLIKLESGRFKNVSGSNKGKIIVKSSVAVSVGTVALV